VSSCTGHKKAVFVGINYFHSTAELHGCINDVKNLQNLLFGKFGFTPETSRTLTDDQTDTSKVPTRANILAALKWLVDGAKPGDSLFFHYSGHGGSVKSTNPAETSGFDETIIPVDFEKAGQIIDDDLFLILVKPLPQGVRLTALFDSCHSGTVLDLPFTYKIDGSLDITLIDNRIAAGKAFAIAGLDYIRGNKAGAFTHAKEGLGFLIQHVKSQGHDPAAAQKIAEEKNTVKADVVQWGGCKDEQTSADAKIEGQASGAMSHAFVTAMNELHGTEHLSYAGVLKRTRELMVQGRYSQVPQLSTGYRMDISKPFTF